MKVKETKMKLNQPVIELPVKDVEKAQQYYHDVFGCQIEWLECSVLNKLKFKRVKKMSYARHNPKWMASPLQGL